MWQVRCITERNEAVPPTIDAKYVVGFVWKHQAQLRLVKNYAKNFWAAISIENPQTTFGKSACGVINGINIVTAGTSFDKVVTQHCSAPGQQPLPPISNFSLNHVSDVIGKLAYESSIQNHKFHIDGLGI